LDKHWSLAVSNGIELCIATAETCTLIESCEFIAEISGLYSEPFHAVLTGTGVRHRDATVTVMIFLKYE
jgi:hypothetical protein